MFLASFDSKQASVGIVRGGCCSLLLALCGAFCQLPAESLCSVMLPVYDPKGSRVSLKVASVYVEGDRSIDLLRTADTQYRVSVDGIKLLFPRQLLGMRRLEIRFADSKDLVLTRVID
jgi:hypothetical protein